MLVAHNGGVYLPTVLAALSAQTRPVDVLLAADTGSTDDSEELLRQRLGERYVISVDAHTGYGSAVDAVLKHQARQSSAARVPARATAGTGDGAPGAGTGDDAPGAGTGDGADRPPGSKEWIWLLQDDAAPAPDTLQLLLEAAEKATTATVMGCKQLDWENHRRLVDVGLWANKWFDRFALIGLDEQDQGQYDTMADVFAVNSAGMLVRRDVFEKLGGFDPALPFTGDDLDFCARVRLTGDRVLVIPDAHMFHVVHRPDGMGTAVGARKAAIFMRLKHAPAWAVPFHLVGTFLAAIYWLVAGFLLKDPGHAVRIFAATCVGLVRPFSLRRSRKSLAAQRTMPRSVHKGLLVENRAVRDQLKMLRETIGPDEELPLEVLNGPSLLEPTGETHQESVAPLAALKTAPIVSALALTALLTIFSLFFLSRFLGVSALAGGALLPVSKNVSSVWQHATDWWVSLGSGLPGHGNPFNYVVAALSGLGGNGSVAVLWLMLLALPLSGFTAWLAAGALTRRRWLRVVAGLAWAGAPMLLVAMGQGRVGALIVHVLIPVVMLGLIRAVGAAVSTEPRSVPVPGAVSGASPIAKLGRTGVNGNPSWTAAAAAGLVLAAVTAAAPSLLPIAVVGILLTTVFTGRRGKTVWWALVPSLAIFLPFAVSAWGNPRALLADPGLPLASYPGPLWQQLLGFPEQLKAAAGLPGLGELGAPSWWLWLAVFLIGAPVVLAAAAALVLPLRRAKTVRALWLLALLALAGAYAGKFIAVAFDGATMVTPFSGPALSLAFFALLGAALLGFDAVYRRAYSQHYRIRASDGAQHHGPATATAVTLSVLLVAAPLASLGLWGAQQLSGNSSALALTGTFLPAAVTAGTIPATAADRGTGAEASRTIVLSVMPEGGVHAALMQGAGTTLDATSSIAAAARITGAPGMETLLETDPATMVLQDSVAAMLSKSSIDPRAGLVELGVGFVVLRNGDTAAELLAGQLEAVPGLSTVGPTESGWLWRVKPSYASEGLSDVVNRVRLLDAEGNTIAPVASQGQNVDTTIAAGAPGRRVVLAERADPQWNAWLNGTELKAVNADWAQAFELPAAGGTLEIRYHHPLHTLMELLQGGLLGLTVLLAVPVRARRGRTGAYRDEASLQKVGRGA